MKIFKNRFVKLTLVSLLFLAGSALFADTPFKNAEEALKALRATDTPALIQALKDVRQMPGFPKGAKPLLPALLWLSDHNDMVVSGLAMDLLKALDWPKVRCMDCLLDFARRQDKVYQLMGITALRKMAFLDAEAYVMLLELSFSPNVDIANMAGRSGGVFKRQNCPRLQDLTLWNTKAHSLLLRFHTAYDRCDKHARSLLQVLTNCPGIDAEVAQGAQDALGHLK